MFHQFGGLMKIPLIVHSTDAGTRSVLVHCVTCWETPGTAAQSESHIYHNKEAQVLPIRLHIKKSERQLGLEGTGISLEAKYIVLRGS